MLAIYIQHRDTRYVKPAEIQNITMLQGTKHGKIFSEIDNVGLTSYHYDPEPGYLGDDQAIFMAEFQGKRYKIVVDIKVLIVVDESASQCGQPQLIKITNPSSGNSGFGSGYNLVSVFVSYRPNPALKRNFAKAALLLRPLLLRWGNRNA